MNRKNYYESTGERLKLSFILLLIVLIISFLSKLAAQEIIKDSITTNGRYVEFKINNNLLVLNTSYPIDKFKEVEGILTTTGKPYFGIKFFSYDYNSEVALSDLYNTQKFKEEFPDAKINFDGVKSIKYNKTSIDNKNQIVTTFTNVYAIKGGLLYLFFNIVNNDKSAAEKEISKFLSFIDLKQNYFVSNTNLHK